MSKSKSKDGNVNQLEDFLGAIIRGDRAAVQSYLALGMRADVRNANGKSALLHALYWRHWVIAEELLIHRADINVQDHRGWTALFWATLNEHADNAALLIRHGANPNIRTLDGEWPLYLAACKGNLETARFGRKQIADRKPTCRMVGVQCHTARRSDTAERLEYADLARDG
ncbi:MAG TPA: ankyrin repeat domain-containing protein [Noviherbaspirillum sp.]